MFQSYTLEFHQIKMPMLEDSNPSDNADWCTYWPALSKVQVWKECELRLQCSKQRPLVQLVRTLGTVRDSATAAVFVLGLGSTVPWKSVLTTFPLFPPFQTTQEVSKFLLTNSHKRSPIISICIWQWRCLTKITVSLLLLSWSKKLSKSLCC